MKRVTIAPTAAQQRTADAESNTILQGLLAAPPAQVAAYIAAHAGTPAQTQQLLTALALAVRALYLNRPRAP